MLEHQYCSELHPDPAWCLCTYPGTSQQLKKVYTTSRSGYPSADYLASSDHINVLHRAESRDKTCPSPHFSPTSRPRWAFHLIERVKATWWGVFPCSLFCELLQAAVPAQAASHPNFATTSLDIFLECLLKLFQTLLADALQDYYNEKNKKKRKYLGKTGEV